MSIHNKKALTGIICGLIAISIISVAYAGTGVENKAVPAKENAVVQAKVGAGSFPAAGVSAGNYLPEFEKIKVDPAYKYLQLKTGDSDNFTVSVENNDNKTIGLKPRTLITPYTENFIEESWISISPSEASLKPGEKEDFEVKVSIPKDAKIGSYSVLIAFTEKIPEGDVAGMYPNFPGTMQLNVQVWVPPSIQILTPYVNDLVEAGKSYTYEIKLRNTGNKYIAISPELTQEGGIIYYGNVASLAVSSSSEYLANVSVSGESSSTASPSIVPTTTGLSQAFGNEAITVEAPEKNKSRTDGVVKLKLAVPANVKGSYGGSLDLNIDDPGIREYEGKVPMNFRILPVLKEPYETTFKARTGDPLTVTIIAYQYRYGLYTAGGNQDLTPSFSVSLKDPSGKEVIPTLVSTKSSGSINIVDDTTPQPRPLLEISSKFVEGMETYNQGNYQGESTTFVETYSLPGSAGK